MKQSIAGLLLFLNLASAHADHFYYEVVTQNSEKVEYYASKRVAHPRPNRLFIKEFADEPAREIFLHDEKNYPTESLSNLVLFSRNYLLREMSYHRIPRSRKFPNYFKALNASRGFFGWKFPSEYKLDFMVVCPENYLCLFENRAYDEKDYGNLIWGATMRWLGFPYRAIQIGSELNEVLGSHRGFWDYRLEGDTPEDQAAIRTGYFSAFFMIYGDLDPNLSISEQSPASAP